MYGYQQKIVIILYLVCTKCDTYDHAPFIDPLFNETPLGHIIPVLHTEWVQMCSSYYMLPYGIMASLRQNLSRSSMASRHSLVV